MYSIIHLPSCKAILEEFVKELAGLGCLVLRLSLHETQYSVGHPYFLKGTVEVD